VDLSHEVRIVELSGRKIIFLSIILHIPLHFSASGLRECNLRQSLFDRAVESIFGPTVRYKGWSRKSGTDSCVGRHARSNLTLPMSHSNASLPVPLETNCANGEFD
jgi:hypothetical protein